MKKEQPRKVAPCSVYAATPLEQFYPAEQHKEKFTKKLLRKRTIWHGSDPHRDNFIDIYLPPRLRQSQKLPVAFPQIEQEAKRREPHLISRKVQLRRPVVEKPGEQFVIRHPICAFFGSSTLSTLRRVPLDIASMIAFLYAARSYGLVSSSTTSVVSSARLSGSRRLWMRIG